jgi:hypothetical protein
MEKLKRVLVIKILSKIQVNHQHRWHIFQQLNKLQLKIRVGSIIYIN